MQFVSNEKKLSLVTELRKKTKILANKCVISDRTSVSDGPTGQETVLETTNLELKLQLRTDDPSLKYKKVLLYVYLSYFLETELQVLIRVLIVERYKHRFNPKQQQLLELAVLEQENCESILLWTFNSPESLFSYVSNKYQKNLQISIFYRQNRDDRVYQLPNRSRHRGYRDKGSLGNQTIPAKEISSDVWILAAEEVLRKKKLIEKDLTPFILETGFFD